MLATQFSPYQLLILVAKSAKAVFVGLFGLVKKGVKRRSEKKKKVVKPKKEKQKSKPEPEIAVLPSQPIVKESPKPAPVETDEQEFSAKPVAKGNWKLPPLSILAKNNNIAETVDKDVP